MRRTHLDLFSGIGGFTLAAEACEVETIGFSEIEPSACRVLKNHWPNIKNYGDIRNVPARKCWLLTGGFPCQPFSVAGEQRGAEDDRFLWPSMLDVIKRCDPTWIIGENVTGIIEMELEKICFDLEQINYEVQPLIIPACAVGAFQHRKRVWICAHAKRQGLPRRIQNARTPCRARAAHSELSNRMPQSWDALARHSRGLRSGDGLSMQMVRDEVKGYGNAIVPQVARQIIEAIIQTEENFK